MKRGLRLSGVALLAMAALLSVACGGDEEESGFSKFLSRYHKVVIGTVSQLDKDKKTMTVTNKKGVAVNLTWTDQTKVEGDLADGASVTVTYKIKGGANVATSVKLRPGAAPAASTATAAPAATSAAPSTATAAAPATTGAKPADKKK